MNDYHSPAVLLLALVIGFTIGVSVTSWLIGSTVSQALEFGCAAGFVQDRGTNIVKTIIAGSRHGHLTPADQQRLDTLEITEVVSGCATGIDADGEAYAKARGLPVMLFPADWRSHGYRAGPLRNHRMARYADAVVLFPGGRGTASMANEARKAGLVIHDWRQASERP